MAERTFVALEDIPFGGVLAYSRGQTVTDADAIERHGWQDLVAATGTKAAAEAQAAITGRDVSEFQTTTTRSAKSTSSDSASTEQKG